MTTSTSLRERKKRQTRAALVRTALQLCAERGPEEVTVADIAAGANVSTRTFFNYFSSKEEAIVGGTEHAERFVQLLADRPDDEPIWDAIRAAAAAAAVDAPERDLASQVRLVSDSPSLAHHQLATWLEMERLLVAEVARRLGTTPTELRPRLLVAAMVAAVRVAIDHWIDAPDGAHLPDLIDEALVAISADLTTTSPSPARA